MDRTPVIQNPAKPDREALGTMDRTSHGPEFLGPAKRQNRADSFPHLPWNPSDHEIDRIFLKAEAAAEESGGLQKAAKPSRSAFIFASVDTESPK